MGDRHLFNSSRMFFAEPDPNWNHIHAEQPYVHFGRVRAADGGSFASHVENMLIDGARSNLHSSLSISMELPYSQVPISSSSYSHESFRQLPAAGSISPEMQNSASSSSFTCQRPVAPAEEITNPIVSNARGSFKRRRLPDSVVDERGSTSGYTSERSFSDPPMYSNLPVGKPNLAPEQWPREIARVIPSNRPTTLSLGGENFLRNVRSRSTLDLDVNLARTCESNTLHHSSSTGRLIYHPGTITGARPTTQENHVLNSLAPHGRLVSDIHDGIHGYGPGHISRRNATVAAQSLHTPVSHVVVGSHNNHRAQRSVPVSRSTHSYQHMGHAINFPPNAQQMVPSSSYSRPLSMICNNSDRSGTWKTPTRRPHLLSGVADANNRLAAQELLALGESIGSVSTGLSEGSILKCLRETKHSSSSDQNQEEDTCVVCLEEYKKKDKVAALMNCGHRYHASCIKKWLSTKNECPICKAPALSDT